jgi:hypothetical protein
VIDRQIVAAVEVGQHLALLRPLAAAIRHVRSMTARRDQSFESKPHVLRCAFEPMIARISAPCATTSPAAGAS